MPGTQTSERYTIGYPFFFFFFLFPVLCEIDHQTSVARINRASNRTIKRQIKSDNYLRKQLEIENLSAAISISIF